MNLTWIDSQFSSRRSDGAIIGGFVIDGRVEWWAHPQGLSTKDGRANGIGPFPTRELAKRALDPEEVQAWTTTPIPFPATQEAAT